MSIPYHMHPAYGTLFPSGSGYYTWQCIHPACGALFDLSVPNDANTIYEHIRVVHNFLSRAPTVPSSQQEVQDNHFNSQQAKDAEHQHQLSRLAHARAGMPTPDRRRGKKSVWDAEFGVIIQRQAGDRWKCNKCGKDSRADAKLVQRHLREYHQVFTTTVNKEQKADSAAHPRH